MNISQFDFALPERLIAQAPADRRDSSRLLVLRRQCEPGAFAHRTFADLPTLLTPGDLLILNDTRVIAARLVGRRPGTGGKWEGLFVRESGGLWEMLLQTRGQLHPGDVLHAESPSEPPLALSLVEKAPSGRWLLRSAESGDAAAILARYGQVPIPPYIRKGRANAADSDRYQTIFARQPGAVAAPTAGLHFTPEVFAALEQRGIQRAFVTLHVGPGTFQPVKVDNIAEHRVEPEWGELPATTAEAIRACRERGGKVVAVGTTSVRVLEAAGGNAWTGLADLTICPPFAFRVVDALLTNFHLPRSSLLLLVSAFAGRETILAAYDDAVRREYRFYSYGDATLILPGP